MTRVRLYPHRVASESSVAWGGWWRLVESGREPIEGPLSGWDYAAHEVLGISVEIEEDEFIRSTGVNAASDAKVVAIADCASVQQRFRGVAPLSGSVTDVEIAIPAGEAAMELRLSAHIVLGEALHEAPPRVARVAGARLASSPSHTVRLEGDASRFPTEVIPFSELGFDSAPWTVMTTYTDLDDSFMGGVRLLVNMENPLGRMAARSEAPPFVAALMRLEVTRLLIAGAADDVLRERRIQYAEGSVGEVLEALCKLYLQRGVQQAAQMYREEPSRFERLLHDRLPRVDVEA